MVHSVSKTPVSRAVAAQIVIDAFGPSATVAAFDELTEGWFNATYALTLGDGQRCVLKVAPPPAVAVLRYEHDIMATEVAALRLARERTSVPVPQVLWSDTTCTRLPSSLFLMEHCAGELLSAHRAALSLEQQQHVDGQLGGHLRELHTMTSSGFGLQAPTATRHSRWSDAFFELIDDALTDGEDRVVELPVPSDVLRELVRRHAAALDEVTLPAFVHWDLWDTNVFIDPESLRVVGIIDFERALWGDPLMEAQFLSHADDATFLAAYGSPVLTTDGAVQRRLLYDLYLFVIMTVEVAYRHYPTDDIERFARNRLARTLNRLGIAP